MDGKNKGMGLVQFRWKPTDIIQYILLEDDLRTVGCIGTDWFNLIKFCQKGKTAIDEWRSMAKGKNDVQHMATITLHSIVASPTPAHIECDYASRINW